MVFNNFTIFACLSKLLLFVWWCSTLSIYSFIWAFFFPTHSKRRKFFYWTKHWYFSWDYRDQHRLSLYTILLKFTFSSVWNRSYQRFSNPVVSFDATCSYGTHILPSSAFVTDFSIGQTETEVRNQLPEKQQKQRINFVADLGDLIENFP